LDALEVGVLSHIYRKSVIDLDLRIRVGMTGETTDDDVMDDQK
jgi:hypothetical protein